MKIQQIRDMTDQEIENTLKTLRKELFNLRFQLATHQLHNPARIRIVKKDIARLLTVKRERELKKEEV
ncbi:MULTISPECIES: 50S ribosomal protein L29 [Caldisericum]|jgi:large subunit ribosomal protein L29|uniref:Large ribosomal subunit protein uL29 n=2 Tax=Caldisericum exile TaxID=693075 RepID=A0A7U6JG54_CALEA|nr:50S ribosomal protein L29 [Caldisericum exile]MCI4463444.1 50S ribosomal protein L29 [Caldisericum sp.]PMP66759.1 MAG: 50S ribosomal protein L29 [Caldisericum exile]BAL81259.1 50S ribosomal protein L29 [Caldisericum exile AZM16c01]